MLHADDEGGLSRPGNGIVVAEQESKPEVMRKRALGTPLIPSAPAVKTVLFGALIEARLQSLMAFMNVNLELCEIAIGEAAM